MKQLRKASPIITGLAAIALGLNGCNEEKESVFIKKFKYNDTTENVNYDNSEKGLSYLKHDGFTPHKSFEVSEDNYQDGCIWHNIYIDRQENQLYEIQFVDIGSNADLDLVLGYKLKSDGNKEEVIKCNRNDKKEFSYWQDEYNRFFERERSK